MKKVFVLTTFLLLSNFSYAVNPVVGFEKNYKKMIEIIRGTLEVGECSISISDGGQPDNPETYSLNVLRTTGLFGFIIDSPKSSNGRSQVSINSDDTQAIYSVSDVLGWTNVIVDYNAEKEVTGLKVYKSYQSHTNKVYEGEIYSVGVVCGIEK